MKTISLSLLVLSLLWSQIKAQTRDIEAFMVGVHLLSAAPLGELQEGNYRKGLGLGVEFLSPSLLDNASPLALQGGVHFDFMGTGAERTANVQTNQLVNALGDYKLYNASAGLLLMVRLSPSTGTVRPYIDGSLGLRGFSTYENIRYNEKQKGYPRLDQHRLISNTTFAYGASIGLMAYLREATRLDLRITYSQGTEATYADLDTFRKVGSMVVYNTRRSATPMVLAHAGFIFLLR